MNKQYRPASRSIGERFGRIVVKRILRKYGAHVIVEAECDCGSVSEKRLNTLRMGYTTSCGCLRSEKLSKRNLRHGKSSTRTYSIWCAMKKRCFNENDSFYHCYGGIGITVCKRWSEGEDGKNGFECFLEDMGEAPDGKSIDRHPNNKGNYEPGNCRWATSQEQGDNMTTTLKLTHEGETLTLREWADKVGISKQVLYLRIYNGWSTKDALFRKRGSRKPCWPPL